MNIKTILNILAAMLVIVGLSMLFPALIAYLYNESDLSGYFYSMALCLSISIPVWFLTRKNRKLSSRDGSRLALKLERMGNITREKILENGRWTYLLLIKKIPISTKSIENAPCLVCPVEGKCSTDGEISPKTCVYIEDWVLTELKTKKRHETD